MEAGLIGAMIAFDQPGAQVVVAVLTYRLIGYWLPTIPQAIAYFQLNRTMGAWKEAAKAKADGSPPRPTHPRSAPPSPPLLRAGEPELSPGLVDGDRRRVAEIQRAARGQHRDPHLLGDARIGSTSSGRPSGSGQRGTRHQARRVIGEAWWRPS